MKRLQVRLGLTRTTKPRYASEPDFIKQVQKQVKALTSDLEYIFSQFEDITPEVTIEALRPTFEKAKHYTPKDTNALVNSAYLEVVGSGSNKKVEIGFAKGGHPRYAVYVHEMVHQKHAEPTRAKFLQTAIDEDIFQIIDRVAEGYRRFMGA